MENKKEFKWELPTTRERGAPMDGDIRLVNLPVQVLFEWSDKIVKDYDYETNTVLEYTSGYVMRVLPDQKFVYKNEPTEFLAFALLK